MKKNIVHILILCIVCVVVFVPLVAGAQQYELLVKDLPYVGADVPSGTAYPLAVYLERFFKLGLAIAVLLSIIIFVYNGVQYMVSDVVGNKADAIGNMKGAVGGLVLAFSIVLILNQINPELAGNFKLFETLGIIKGEISKPPPATTPPPNAGWEAAIREELKSHGVGVNNQACGAGSSGSGCTTLYGMPGNVLTALYTIAAELGGCSPARWPNCTVTITGGVEPGHATHAPGKPFVDIRLTGPVNNYIITHSDPAQPPKVGNYDYYKLRDKNIWAIHESDHWHMCIGIPCEIAGG